MRRRFRAAVVLAGVATVLLAGCAAPGEASADEVRRQAAVERAQPPQTPTERPTFLREPRHADPALAQRSLAEVETALAPLREAAEAPAEPPPSAAVATARAAATRGDLDAAARTLLEQVRRAPQDVAAWRELGRVLDAAGRRDLAGDAWTRVLSMQPADPEALGAGGVDAAAARRSLQAAERLLRLRQLRRVGEAPEAEPGEAASQLVALGLSLRELGHLRAAATCLDEASAIPMPKGSRADALRRQSGDLRRMAAECWAALGSWDEASAGFRAALQVCGPEDRVALPRLVWSQLEAGRRWGAVASVLDAMPPDAPGHAGLGEAARLVRASWRDAPLDRLLASDADALARRSSETVAWQAEHPPERAPRLAPDARAWLSAVAQTRGPEAAADLALRWIAAEPGCADRVAVASRGMPVEPARWRQVVATAAEPDRRLLAARFDLAGGDAESALSGVRGVNDWRERPTLLAAAIDAAAAMEDRRRILECVPSTTADARVAAAVAQAFAAVGDADQAERWAERAIEIDRSDARAWLARAAADLARGARERPESGVSWRSQAAISAERAWEADPGSAAAARHMLELSAADSGVQSELEQLMVQGSDRGTSRREWDRHQALRRVQQGQGEPVIETLRALLVEDPTDVPVAAALVAAAASSGELQATEAWLERLRTLRPAAPAIAEGLVSAKARQGRLTEGVQILREAAERDPESAARRRAWARALAVAGRAEEAWSVLAPLCGESSGPRAGLECAELAMRAGRDGVALETLQAIVRSPDLTAAQRLSLMALAGRLPRSVTERRELLASAGAAAMELPDAGPSVLAAAMLAGTDADAAALAERGMRPWKAPASLEAAQSLLDEGLPARAQAFLQAAVAKADRAERRAIERALVAVLCAEGLDGLAETRLRAWRQGEGAALLADRSEASLADDLNELGGSLLLAGRRAAAERVFEHAVEADPAASSPLNNLAWLRIERGQLDKETGELVRRAIAAAPDDPSTLDTAAWWEHLQPVQPGVPPKAPELLQRATASDAPSLESLDHLGDALWSADRHEEAARAWRAVAESASGRASRDRVMQAFNLMQKRLWGVRAWDAASFYDARDGAAIGRAQAKLKALAEGRPPPVTPRPAPVPADPAPTKSNAP